MGLTQHIPSPPPHWVQRIPAPPPAWRLDAVFVGAVSDLASMRRDRVGGPARGVDDAG